MQAKRNVNVFTEHVDKVFCKLFINCLLVLNIVVNPCKCQKVLVPGTF